MGASPAGCFEVTAADVLCGLEERVWQEVEVAWTWVFTEEVRELGLLTSGGAEEPFTEESTRSLEVVGVADTFASRFFRAAASRLSFTAFLPIEQGAGQRGKGENRCLA